MNETSLRRKRIEIINMKKNVERLEKMNEFIYEKFLTENKDKSYKELLIVRDNLIKEIQQFEALINYKPSNEEVEKYEVCLYLLTQISMLILDKYNQKNNINLSPVIPQKHYLILMKEFLEEKGFQLEDSILIHLKEREEGKKFSTSEHIRGFIYALLTNQTKWKRIEEHLPEIDALFFDYDVDKLKATPPEYFYQEIFKIKCGNISTKAQMEALKNNIEIFEKIKKAYGNIDAFVTSEPVAEVVKMLSKENSCYKLKMMGEALTWEYIRNVGIDGAKLDTHLRRFFGSNRLGKGKNCVASIEEVMKQVDELSGETGLTKVEIDNLIWSYCADGYGEICTATPHCKFCVIRSFCKYEK